MEGKERQEDMGDSQVRILIAEDNPPVAEVMRLALSRQGWWVQVVGNGLEAVEQTLAEEYDLILMDHRMPGCSGAEAARRILAARPSQRIAMVTGTPADREIRRIVEKEGPHCLTKPFSPQELVEAVRRWLDKRG
jgi:CheY-like chemotaxis protein